MKNLLLLLTLFISAFASSQNIAFHTVEHDFGEVKAEDGGLYYNFKLKNLGTQQVKIGNLAPSCSCLYVSMEDKLLDPGEEGEIHVTLLPSGYSGLVYRTVDVYTESGTHLETLSLYAKVIPAKEDIRVYYPIFLHENLLSNRDNLNFGYLYWLNSSELSVGLANISGKELTLSALVKGKGSAEVNCPKRLMPGESSEIIVKYTANEGEYLSLNDELQIYIDGKPINKTIGLKCIIIGKLEKTSSSPSLWSTPSLATMKKRGSTYSGTIELGNSGKSDLRVLEVYTDGAQINIKKGTVVPKGKNINVKVISTEPKAKIELFTNDPVRPYKELLYNY